jgi:hypothetical protein
MLIKFSEWIKIKESSPATRNKLAVAWGTAVPMSADVFGHATPPAWQVPKIMDAINGKKRKTKKRKPKRKRK